MTTQPAKTSEILYTAQRPIDPMLKAKPVEALPERYDTFRTHQSDVKQLPQVIVTLPRGEYRALIRKLGGRYFPARCQSSSIEAAIDAEKMLGTEIGDRITKCEEAYRSSQPARTPEYVARLKSTIEGLFRRERRRGLNVSEGIISRLYRQS